MPERLWQLGVDEAAKPSVDGRDAEHVLESRQGRGNAGGHGVRVLHRWGAASADYSITMPYSAMIASRMPVLESVVAPGQVIRYT